MGTRAKAVEKIVEAAQATAGSLGAMTASDFVHEHALNGSLQLPSGMCVCECVLAE